MLSNILTHSHTYYLSTVPGKPEIQLMDQNATAVEIRLTTPSFVGKDARCTISLTHAGVQEDNRTIQSLAPKISYNRSVSSK